MTIDPEERKRQRQELAEKRRQTAARQKAMLIRLGIAAAVLLACGLLILLLPRGNNPAADTTQTGTAAESTANAQPQTTSPDPVTTVHLTFGGDLNITDSVVTAGAPDYDYTAAFLDVAPLFADADLAALNFEGILYGTPYGSKNGNSAPQQLVQALARAGVDMVQLANSCCLNQGLSGLVSTISGIRAAGIEPLGAYPDQAAFQDGKGYVIRQVNGIRIAFVAFTKGMDGLTLPAGSEDCVNVLYSDYDSTYQTIDREGILQVLSAAHKEKPDITIAMLHWGSEFNDTISASQTEIVELMQDEGVDAIIGTHSHYVQQMVYDRAKGTFVAYCLGDLFGDGSRPGSEYSVVLDLEVTKDNGSGDTKISGYSYTPVFTVSEAGAQKRVVRIKEAMAAYEGGYIEAVSEQTYAAMAYALTRIEARVTGQ